MCLAGAGCSEVSAFVKRELCCFLSFKPLMFPFTKRLKKQSWCAKSFVVKDPGGNLLLFAEPEN